MYIIMMQWWVVKVCSWLMVFGKFFSYTTWIHWSGTCMYSTLFGDIIIHHCLWLVWHIPSVGSYTCRLFGFLLQWYKAYCTAEFVHVLTSPVLEELIQVNLCTSCSSFESGFVSLCWRYFLFHVPWACDQLFCATLLGSQWNGLYTRRLCTSSWCSD